MKKMTGDKIISSAAFLCLFALTVFIGCAKEDKAKAPPSKESADDVYSVFVTIQPLESIAASIAGDRAVIHVLLPPGADPHTYEPTPGDVKNLEDSAILFHIGMGLDDWAAKIALAAKDGPRIYPVAAGVPSLPAVPERMRRSLKAGGKMPAHGNPHVWLDPNVMATIIIPTMARAFAAADPPNTEFYMKNAARISKRIEAFSENAMSKLEPFAGKSVILHHGSFIYFFRRYNIKVIDILEPFPGQEPSPKELKNIIESAKKNEAVAIFSEPQVSPKPAMIIADELNIPIIDVDPLGQASEDYIELMERNLNAIATGLE